MWGKRRTLKHTALGPRTPAPSGKRQAARARGPGPGGGLGAPAGQLRPAPPATPTDHPQLHAPLPAAIPRGLRGPAEGQRALRPGELQVLRLHRDPVHGGDGLPEPPGGWGHSPWSPRPEPLPTHTHPLPFFRASAPEIPLPQVPWLPSPQAKGPGSHGLLTGVPGGQGDGVGASSLAAPDCAFSSLDHPAENRQQPFCQGL